MSAVAAITGYEDLVERLDLERVETVDAQVQVLLDRRAELLDDLHEGDVALGRGIGGDELRHLQAVRDVDVLLVEGALTAMGVAFTSPGEGDDGD